MDPLEALEAKYGIGKKTDPLAELEAKYGVNKSSGWEQEPGSWGETGVKQPEATTPKRKTDRSKETLWQELLRRDAERGQRTESVSDLARRIGNIEVLPGGEAVRYAQEAVTGSGDTPNVAGMVRGATNLVTGPAQWLANKVGYGDQANRMQTDLDTYYRENFNPSVTGEMVGGALPTMGAGSLVKGGGMLAEMAMGAGTGYAAGATAPVVGANTPEEYSTRSGEAGLIGGGVGAVAPLVMRGGRAISEKTKNALAGTKFGDWLGIPTEVKPQYRGSVNLANELEKKGITNVSPGDVTSDPNLKRSASDLASTSQEYNAYRRGGLVQTKQYAEKEVEDLAKKMDSAGFSNLADVQAASQTGGKRSEAAARILADMKKVGGDELNIAQVDARLKALRGKMSADVNFNKASSLMDRNLEADPSGLYRSSSDSYSKMERNPAVDESTKSFYKKIREAFKPAGQASPPSFNQEGVFVPGKPGAERGTGGLSYEDMRSLRTSLNARKAAIEAGTITATSDELTHLAELERESEKALKGLVSRQSKPAQAAHEFAVSEYKREVVPYKEMRLGRALSDEDAIKFKEVFSGDNIDQQRRAYDLMGEKGKAAISAYKLKKAVQAGMSTPGGVMDVGMDPKAIADNLEAMKKTKSLDLFFPKGEGEGMLKIMRIMEDTSKLNAAPPDVLGGSRAWVIKRILQKLNQGHLIKLHSDPKGRLLLQRLNRVSPNNPEFRTLVRSIPAIVGMNMSKADNDASYLSSKIDRQPGEWRPVDEAMNPNE